MAKFETAYTITCSSEGGYVNDKADKGGETFRGISRKNFPSWTGWIYVDALKTKPNFPKSLDSNSDVIRSVSRFYKETFWDKMSLDDVKSQEIANELFDTGVNQGLGTAGIYLQRVLNVSNRSGADFPDLLVDGVIGIKTVNVLNAHKNPKAPLKGLNVLQGYKYFTICEANPSQEKFWNGWMNRVFEV